MYNFFVNADNKKENRYFIMGDDYKHIKNVLRMTVGEQFLVSCNDISDLCEIESFESDTVVVKIIEKNYQSTNLPIKIHLFQGLPKSDKLELIIQKAVELGVTTVTPVSMKRSIVKIDDKKKKSKQERWQAIATAAAKQSKRTSVPEVCDIISYKEFIERAKDLDLLLVPYECAEGMSATKTALSEIKNGMNVGIIIGPEGGFEEKEVDTALSIGGKVISLGSRILRTETAAITSIAMCMLYSEMEL
ncbi:MAG: 16S rRNA (uracil(1498)-N(3))-methyltransferase [Ruminococcaceae bacterium]|nr:16S rRNA (uracil(1498)-N(3))-methyltransferase [Oscillospiraceae bacterium]